MVIRIAAPEFLPVDLLMLAEPSLERVRESLAGSELFLGEDAGRAVAVAVMRRSGLEAEVLNIAVAEGWQGRRLGTQMLRHLVGQAAAGGARRVLVGTGNSSLSQLAFYQKNGFRIVGVISDYFADDDPPIFENGIRCRDMIRLSLELGGEGEAQA